MSKAASAERYLLEAADYAASVRQRIAQNTSVDENGCWVWTKALLPGGYARIKVMGFAVNVMAHRASYLTHVGPIPDGLQLDHLCRNRACANPNHLQPVTQVENMARGVVWNYWRSRTACKNGHVLTEVNVYMHRNARHCRTCRAENDHRRQQALKLTVTIPVTAT